MKMKNIILIFLICAVARPVYAIDFCENLASVAEKIMKNRQNGVSMAYQVEVMREEVDEYEESKLYEEMIKEAYAMPQRSTMKERLQEVEMYKKGRFDYCKEMEAIYFLGGDQ